MRVVIIGGIVAGAGAPAVAAWGASEIWSVLGPTTGPAVVRTDHAPGAHVTYRYDPARAMITDVQVEAIDYCRRTGHAAQFKDAGLPARDGTREANFDCVPR